MSISKWNVQKATEIFNKLFHVLFLSWNIGIPQSSFPCLKHPFIILFLSHPTLLLLAGDLICILCIICLPSVLCFISHFFLYRKEILVKTYLCDKTFMLSFQFHPERYEQDKMLRFFVCWVLRDIFAWLCFRLYDCVSETLVHWKQVRN